MKHLQPSPDIGHCFPELGPFPLRIAENPDYVSIEIGNSEQTLASPDTSLTSRNPLDSDCPASLIEPLDVGWRVGQKPETDYTRNDGQKTKEHEDVSPRSKGTAVGVPDAIVNDQRRNRHEAIGQSL